MDIEFIEKLRVAAKEHGAVYDLLCILDRSLLIDGNGNKEIVGDDEDVSWLKDAMVAAGFASYDRKDEK